MGEDQDDEAELFPTSNAAIESFEKVKLEDVVTNEMCATLKWRLQK
jgi:hypothetical protein